MEYPILRRPILSGRILCMVIASSPRVISPFPMATQTPGTLSASSIAQTAFIRAAQRGHVHHRPCRQATASSLWTGRPTAVTCMHRICSRSTCSWPGAVGACSGLALPGRPPTPPCTGSQCACREYPRYNISDTADVRRAHATIAGRVATYLA